MKTTPHRNMIFFAADDAGGGGAAVAEPLVVATPEANADLMDFAPPALDDVMSSISSTAKEPTVEPEKPEPVKAPEPKGGKKPDGKNGEPPAAQLRRELENLKAERDELRGKLEQGDPRLVEAQNAVKEKEAEVTKFRQQVEDYEKKLLMQNPAVTAKLREMDSKYNDDATRFRTRVPEVDQGAINQLVQEYARLPFNSPEYREARVAFENKINELLGGSEDMPSRKLESVLGFVERTFDFIQERGAAQKEIETNARKLALDAERGDYGKRKEFVKSALERARQVPEDLAKANPMHPKVMLKAFLESVPEDQKNHFEENVPEFIELVMAGLSPRTDDDYAGMSSEQVAESRRMETERYEQARGHAVDVMYNGLQALRILPTLVKENQRLSAKLREQAEAEPPDPTKGGGSGDAADDVKAFQPPSLDNLNF